MNHEIIVIGKCNLSSDNLKVVSFNQGEKPMWITRKKNMISDQARFENVCYLHDYIILDKDWYAGYEKFGYNWDMCMNQIINKNGKRFRDWTLWYPQLINYDDNTKTKDMYISGSYFCAKKQFMIKYRLNESLTWGQGQDVDHSHRVRNFWNYKMNKQSKVYFLKQKYMDDKHRGGF